MAFVRKSKYKHIFGKPLKREQCYENIRVTKSSWDSTFCAVNPKYVAIVTEAAGGGSFLVLPVGQVGRLERDPPLVAGHRAAVLDIAWCPHNDDLIASASEDCTVKLWIIPDGGLKPHQNLVQPAMELIRHQRRVGLVLWHPSAASVLLSAGADNKVFIWNVEVGDCLVEMEFPDMITSASFNFNGSRLAFACKDRKIRIVEPRTGEQLAEGQLHEGNKVQQVCYIRNGDLITTGFSRTGDRQVGLWKTDNFKSPLALLDLDTSNGVNFIFYDGDTNMVYLCGKGDSVVRYFEVTDEEPYLHFVNLFQSTEPQRGMGSMPKRGLNVNECEIMRFYKLHSKGFCEVIPFIVPRKSELFQEDLYPDTPGEGAAIAAQDWFSGSDADPVLVSLKDGYKPTASVAASLNRKVGPSTTVATQNATNNAASSAVSAAGTNAATKPLSASAVKPLSGHSAASNGDAPRSGVPNANGSSQSAPGAKSSSTSAPAGVSVSASTPNNGKAQTQTQAQTIENLLATQTAPAAGGAQTVTLTLSELQQVVDDMRKMKVIIKGHEKRIKQLEDKLKQVETDLYDENADAPAQPDADATAAATTKSTTTGAEAVRQHHQKAAVGAGDSHKQPQTQTAAPATTAPAAATATSISPVQFNAFPDSLYG